MVKSLENTRILIHSLTFYPDQVSTAALYFEIAKHLENHGAKVTVFTTYPHYNPPSSFEKNSKWFLFFRKSEVEGIDIFHVYQSKTKNILLRGLLLLYFHLAFILFAVFKFNFEVVITPSPPLTSGILSGFFATMNNAKSVYNVQEIHPDMLLKQNRLVSPLMPILRLVERKTYQLSDKVVTIHDYFSETVSKRTSREKLVTIPNFANGDYSRAEKVNCVSDDFHAERNTFVLGYFGNIGFLQDWNLVIDSIIELQKKVPITLLLIGGGGEYTRLKMLSESLDFLTVLPYMPKAKLDRYVNSINAHLICMTKASDFDGLPSKIYSILAIGIPIIAVTSSSSPTADVLLKSKNAVLSPLGDKIKFQENIVKLYRKEINLYPDYCIDYIDRTYSKETILNSYLALIVSLKNRYE